MAVWLVVAAAAAVVDGDYYDAFVDDDVLAVVSYNDVAA